MVRGRRTYKICVFLVILMHVLDIPVVATHLLRHHGAVVEIDKVFGLCQFFHYLPTLGGPPLAMLLGGVSIFS